MKRKHRPEKVTSEGHVHLFVCLTLKWRASSHVAMNNSYSCEQRPWHGDHMTRDCLCATSASRGLLLWLKPPKRQHRVTVIREWNLKKQWYLTRIRECVKAPAYKMFAICCVYREPSVSSVLYMCFKLLLVFAHFEEVTGFTFLLSIQQESKSSYLFFLIPFKMFKTLMLKWHVKAIDDKEPTNIDP